LDLKPSTATFYQKTAATTSRALAIGGNFAIVCAVQLEDHIGDITRKACAMSNVSPAAAASAAGLSEAEFTAFGETGRSAKPVNFTALGQLIGLNPTKLEAIAKGWLPAPIDLSVWREIRVVTTKKDDLTVNGYIVWDEVTRDAALFDTGVDAQAVLDLIAAEGLSLRHIFLTHSHWDHVDELPKIRAAHPKAKVHTNSKNAPVDQRNKNAEIIPLGGLRITHRETPGHAEDGVTYLIGNWQEDAPHVAIVGDAIFAGSLGRGNQSWDLARQKVREQILTLPGPTLLCPGHGPLTTVAEEKAHNPFF
jgi:hydroxyacylglutathione hydrolase